jgi:hypothetical protein
LTDFTLWTKYTTYPIDHNTFLALINDARFSACTTTLGAASDACGSIDPPH